LPQYTWHVHHDRLVEILTAPMQERIDFINKSKAERERPLRLRLFKLVKNQSLIASIDEAYKKATAPAYEAYKKARATADEAYEKAMALADEAYEKAMAPADEAYKKAMAPADEAYEKAMAPADEAYKKARATAYEAYEKAINDLHEKECRNCPWNGETIFSGKVRA